MELFRRRPRTFAEYMATPAKREQRDAILVMCDDIERRSAEYLARELADYEAVMRRYDAEDEQARARKVAGGARKEQDGSEEEERDG